MSAGDARSSSKSEAAGSVPRPKNEKTTSRGLATTGSRASGGQGRDPLRPKNEEAPSRRFAPQARGTPRPKDAERGRRSPTATGIRTTGTRTIGTRTAGIRPSRHASITELELRFARNPQSDAYRELAEAYVEAGRFMEAMVVSKKGIKAHPESVNAKVLLAEVYARQKKYPRALRELDRLADDHPEAADVFASRGRIRVDAGEEEAGIGDLKRALDLDPNQSEAAALLAARGIRYPDAKPPPAPPIESIEPDPSHAAESAAATLGAAPVTPVAPGPIQTLVPPEEAAAFPVSRADLAATGSAFPAATAPPGSIGSLIPEAPAAPANPAASMLPPPGHAPDAPFRVTPQRLEGEDELERMAQRLAEEKPPRGKPKTTLVLVTVLSILTIGVVVERLLHKSKIEAIDGLTVQAEALFNEDVYGSYQDAAKHLEEVLERHDPDHGPSLARLAHIYAILLGEHGEEDRHRHLTAILDQAEELAPEAPHTIAALTLARLYQGKNRDAAARTAVEFAEPLVEKPDTPDRPPSIADLALGIAEMHLGEYERATRRLEIVKEVLHDSVRAKVAYGRAAFRARRLSAARAGFEAALRSEPDHPGARAGLALTKLRRGDLNGAAADLLKFDEVARARPKDISRPDAALAEFARSEVLRSAGDETKAAGAYEQAVRLDPDNPEFAFGLGRWLLQNYRAKEALAPLRQAVKQDPHRWAFLVELAEAEMRAGNWSEAEKRIDQARARAPSVVEVKLAKARLLRRTKKPETEAYIKGLMEKHASRAREINLELGRWYRSQGKLALAQAAFETAIESMARAPRLEQAEALLSYGKLMDDMSRHEWALNSYRKAADLGAIEGWYRASKALKRAGQRNQAKKACERYLQAGRSLRYFQSAKRLCDSL